MEIVWLDAQATARALPMEAALAAVEKAFVDHYEGNIDAPLRLQIAARQYDGVSLVMPAHSGEPAYTSLKVVSVYPGNPQQSLPAINGLVTLLDGATGQPKAILHGGMLTALRTGAGSGVATKALARPDAQVLAVIGAGAQAPYQALAVASVRPIGQINLFNRTESKAEALAQTLRRQLPQAKVTVHPTVTAAVAQADVICTVTNATSPLLSQQQVAPGTHINAVGSFRPHMQELTPALVGDHRPIFVDDNEAAAAEAGEIVRALQAGRLQTDGLVEIGAVLSGAAPGRLAADQITIFKSCGIAAQDLHSAVWAYRAAKRDNLGLRLSL